MPETLEPPVAPTPAQAPSPTMDAFDQTFSDLEPSPSTTPQTPNAPVPETTRPVPSKIPATGKFTKQDKPDAGKAGEATDKPPVQDGQVGGKSDDGKLGEVSDKRISGPEYQPPMVAKPSELKQWAKRMGTRAEQAEQQLVQINRKLKELESRPNVSGDVQAVTAELAATKKRLEEHESQLRVTKYERSEHYKDNYEKPYQEVVSKAYRKVAQLVVTEPKPNGQVDENGKPTEFNERQATPADLDAVYYAGNPMLQRRVAKQLFGEDFQTALNLCEAIQEKKESAIKAIEDNKVKATEYEKQQTTQQQMEQQGRTLMYNQAVQAIAQKYPDLFGEREGDTKWNEALAKGRHMADLAFSDRQGLTPEQSVILDAQIHARISGYPGVKAERDQFKSERDALKKELEDIRASGPGKPAAGSVKGEAKHLTLDQAFDEAVPE